jgi:hypothetical protein
VRLIHGPRENGHRPRSSATSPILPPPSNGPRL